MSPRLMMKRLQSNCQARRTDQQLNFQYSNRFSFSRNYISNHSPEQFSIPNLWRFVGAGRNKETETARNIIRHQLVVDQVAVDLFAELGNWLANVSSPYEVTSSVRSLVGTSSWPACVYVAFKGYLLSSDVIGAVTYLLY
ncbi:hypothetical protein T265_08786 [Opisthorchis viverrini]|uniref:Uncharacterized protein n=1 Tax=Opisthorchis viverrini TaxID=6198 RepID=A0A074ZCH4_OPIVI|nr:hypothetical protein T265_08786 [Opisthorchis viverrini]KER23302.1 hypothetical protein T265_08786 [Opisthorchis viverrini]